MLLPLTLVAHITLNVCPTCEINKIGSAIEQAPEGATILVQTGIYKEGEIVISKSLRLIGEGYPILDGDHIGDVIRVANTNDVEVSGFEIRNSGKSYIKEFAGIKIEDVENCKLKRNRLHDNNFGIYLANSNGCEIENNFVTGILSTESDTGNGIHIWQGANHRLSANILSASRDGIYFEFVTDSIIAGNRSFGNLRYGLHFMFSHRDKYVSNEFFENGAGVAVMYSQDIEMERNHFHTNQGMSAYGLLLKDIRKPKIKENVFESNSIGIYMEGTSRGDFTLNKFLRSGWALRIMGDCESNNFRENDFSGNTFDVATNSSYNPNKFSGNYWSNYDGYDLNRDGIGDVPFRLVSLSSVIHERVSSSYVLLRSSLYSLLDRIERALPVLIPAALEDDQPRMSPVVQ